MFDVNLACAGRVRHYSILLTSDAGWEARIEEDSTVRWRETYEDWHRVEAVLARVRREVSDLLKNGWTINR
jgi:hypothetical protein